MMPITEDTNHLDTQLSEMEAVWEIMRHSSVRVDRNASHLS